MHRRYSAVSWAVNIGAKRIRTIDDWPNPRSMVATSAKVATKISYRNGIPNEWGFNISPKEQYISRFKLLLNPKNKVGRASDEMINTLQILEAMNKAPEQVAADYLHQIWQYTKSDILKMRGDDWEENHVVRIILTVPAIWTDSAKDVMLKTVREAGLPDNVVLLSEPEAAAWELLRERRVEGEPLRVEERFVVCDAGGETVNLNSYKVCSLYPFQIEQCASSDGL